MSAVGCCMKEQAHVFVIAMASPLPRRIPHQRVAYCVKSREGFNWHLLSVPLPPSSCVPNMGLANIPESNQSLHDLVKAQWHLVGASIIKHSNISWLLFYGTIKLEMPGHYVSIIFFSIASLFFRYSNCQTSKLLVARNTCEVLWHPNETLFNLG